MPALEAPREGCYAIEYRTGKKQVKGVSAPAFTLSFSDESQLQRILDGDDYSIALAYIRGEFDVKGDLIEAFRLKDRYTHPNIFHRLWAAARRFAPARLETWFQSEKRAASDIRFHYDRSNEFYKKFLDSRLVYSAADFKEPGWSLEQAQQAKLDGICTELDLRPGQRFLDVGCGWGALITHAALRYKVDAVGCTLSHNQCEYAKSAIAALGLKEHVTACEMDYRDLSQRFDKIASVGMFEHVGRRRLGSYFRKIYGLLGNRGLFLNSGIARPQLVEDDPQTWFLFTRVFPGGELPHLSDLVREAETAGFDVLQVEGLRKHYARTCRAWVERLRKNADSCRALVGQETYRTWLLYLSASALNFETGQTDAFRMLLTKDMEPRKIW